MVDAAVDRPAAVRPACFRDVGEARLERKAGRLAARLRPDAARRHPLAERRTRRGERQQRDQRRRRVIIAGSVAVERLPGLDILEFLDDARWPSDLDERRGRVGAEPDEQSLVAGGEIADGGRDREVLRQPGGGHDLHAAPDAVAVRLRADRS